MDLKFYRCGHCGNIVTKIEDKRVPVVCCGEKMAELVPNTTDAAQEKHVPVVERLEHAVCVCVGSVSHPMTKEHNISFIAVTTNNGFRIQYLTPDDAPEALFALADGEEVGDVFAYCNLHGLWKA